MRSEALQGTWDVQAPTLRGAPAPQQLGHWACLYVCLHGYCALCLCFPKWGICLYVLLSKELPGWTRLTWCAAVLWGIAGKHSNESVVGHVFALRCPVVQRCAWMLLVSCTRHAGSCKGPQRCFSVCLNQAAATLVAHMQACMHQNVHAFCTDMMLHHDRPLNDMHGAMCAMMA